MSTAADLALVRALGNLEGLNDIEIDLEDADASVVIDGSPATGSTALGEVAGAEVGVWVMTPGSLRDVEAAEVSIVVAGRGSVEFDDGSVLELVPGVVFRLTDGQHAIWRVSVALRKLYIVA
ncbi:cupin domain-containing protein [Gryllotalpicola sp.]|uniref:cupin domain-containing protein n=1 Tax=Gryllotalpicola sp. TaxID=1932787 RepID=UPI0026058D72|nr:cupin domain-containing protein [Gryllotalpicola sp.]